MQLDYDEELLNGMYGSMDAELEVQRTIKKAELTAFFCLLKKVIGPIKVHVDNKGIIDGLRRGEGNYIIPKAGDAHLWIEIWDELQSLAAEDNVKAHRTKKEKSKMHRSHYEKFVTEGN